MNLLLTVKVVKTASLLLLIKAIRRRAIIFRGLMNLVYPLINHQSGMFCIPENVIRNKTEVVVYAALENASS